MNANQWRVIGTGLLYLIIFGTGYWLGRSGKPLNTFVLTVHKLISLAAVTLLVVTIVQVNRVTRLGAGDWIASAVTGLLFVGTIATGGMLSADRPMPAAALLLHRITPYLTVLSSAVTLFLLLGRK